MRILLCIWGVVISGLLIGCGGGGGGGTGNTCMPCGGFTVNERNVYSPNGSIPFGAKAYSMDGQHYAMELEPNGNGHIGFFSRQTDVLERQIDLQLGSTNDIKGLAWSPNSILLAVMYHGGGGGSAVYILNHENGRVFSVPIQEYYHYMTFYLNDINTLNFILSDTCGCEVDSKVLADTFKSNSGANLPWINYGWDIGHNPYGIVHGGFSSNIVRLNSDFNTLAGMGASIVRVFIFCDLRSGFVMGTDTNTGRSVPFSLDEYVFDDMDALVSVASTNNLKIIPVLFDYMIADGISLDNEGNILGEYPNLLTTDRSLLLALISQFLERYADSGIIYAWDIFNEPELANAVTQAEMTTFINELVQIVHSKTRHDVTLGSRNRSTMSQWNNSGLDLYQYHYYDDMEAELPLNYPVNNFGLDKSVIVGEAQPTSVNDKLQNIEQNGYKGVLFWSLNGNDGYDLSIVLNDYFDYFSH